MISLRDRLLEKLAFDKREARSIANHSDWASDAHVAGAKAEHARNRALVLALVECVEALEKNNQMTMWKARAEALAAVEAALNNNQKEQL